MPATTRSPLSRPNNAPAYYLGRPASWWITALRQHRTGRTAAGQAGAAPARPVAG